MCDVFCMPSKFEAYGLVFIEALTFGLPCIGREAYEMPYFIEDGKTGYLLRKETPEALSNLIIAAISNKVMRDTVMSMRDTYIREYSWNSVCKRITEIIDGMSATEILEKLN